LLLLLLLPLLLCSNMQMTNSYPHFDNVAEGLFNKLETVCVGELYTQNIKPEAIRGPWQQAKGYICC